MMINKLLDFRHKNVLGAVKILRDNAIPFQTSIIGLRILYILFQYLIITKHIFSDTNLIVSPFHNN